MMIYIVRHGETQWNADGRIQGRRDIELNENGRRQAEAAAEALRGKSFQALITSPLSRAKQTGAILAQFAQIAEVREDARIVERDFGELDGARFTEDVRHRLYQEKVQGAESLEEVAARMAEAFDEYVQQYDGDILVVSHGAAQAAGSAAAADACAPEQCQLLFAGVEGRRVHRHQLQPGCRLSQRRRGR